MVVGPGTVAGLIPWSLSGWEFRDPMPFWAPVPLQVLGALVLLAGASVLVHAFVRFAVEGLGTPVPAAPPQHLVVGGLYRVVRNPMYVALLWAVVGQALLFGQWSLLVYGATIWIGFALFVRWREEPVLARRFGTEYDTYRRAVRAWWPRLRPWDPSVLGPTRAVGKRGEFG
ncbi:MAG: isoprenylcysteine carboxyl methyltransferase [Pseudonocardiaceae bacterium]|nr:isoprenylcysteine carboxyl methyltransferase [Pseudonocardiaceae bacterium]